MKQELLNNWYLLFLNNHFYNTDFKASVIKGGQNVQLNKLFKNMKKAVIH